MKSSASLMFFAVSVVLAASGCKESRASTEPAASATQADSVVAAAATKPAAVTAKIVFIDMEDGCACTQKRVDAGWAALQAALAGKSAPAIERIHMDTQSGQAEPYGKLRAMMAAPALYFIDAKGGLVELLQGEVTAAQIQAVLRAGTAGH